MSVQYEIGGWWAMCCIHDLQHIRTQEELDEARRWLEDEEDVGARYWPTLEAALAEVEEDGSFERGIAYGLRRYFGLPMSAQSVVKNERS